MKTELLEELIVQLSAGDDKAAEEVFRAYEPYLRLVVRRMLPNHLRPKFDSVDVVQSVWADVLRGFRAAGWQFRSPGHLKAFLVKVTRNHFIDRVRKYRTAVELEQSLAGMAPEEPVLARDPQPSEVAQAQELWEKMLALCPPAHRQILHLKRQGRTLAEIAADTGLHPSSIRRILYDVARRLAEHEPVNLSAIDD
ncbi:MAG: RNA polymerase sigma factor [Gemmataceae bacterium]